MDEREVGVACRDLRGRVQRGAGGTRARLLEEVLQVLDLALELAQLLKPSSLYERFSPSSSATSASSSGLGSAPPPPSATPAAARFCRHVSTRPLRALMRKRARR